MDSAEIILSIGKIYLRFPVPTSLQLHMMRVAGVGELICDKWEGPRINKEDVVAALLIHDLGNIVKFDFSPRAKKLIRDRRGLSHWKLAKEKVIARYGAGEHSVTLKMVKEIGVCDRVRFLIRKMGDFQDPRDPIIKSNDWELKIVTYGDARVSPKGVVSLKERYRDLIARRKGEPVEKIYHKDAPRAIKLERQLFSKVGIKPSGVSDRSIRPYILKYRRIVKRRGSL